MSKIINADHGILQRSGDAEKNGGWINANHKSRPARERFVRGLKRGHGGKKGGGPNFSRDRAGSMERKRNESDRVEYGSNTREANGKRSKNFHNAQKTAKKWTRILFEKESVSMIRTSSLGRVKRSGSQIRHRGGRIGGPSGRISGLARVYEQGRPGKGGGALEGSAKPREIGERMLLGEDRKGE